MSAPRRGRVILVGAGPGAPDLITVRGMAVLRDADAILYDELASEDLLAFASPHATRVNVGKRGHDAPTRSQPETTALLIELAREGKTVVRLKGGDPFVFGRGGEEATACVDAGIPFEVVPGISSAVGALAYAGIPLTDRRHSASFAVVTGHKDPTKVAAATRWDLLARGADTLVVLMGMRNLESLVAELLAAGRAPATPAAVVMNGTLPSQRVVEAPLSGIVLRVRSEGLAAPAVFVVGDVVQLRESLAWYEKKPLFGRRILVTRPADRDDDLAAALREAGAEPVIVPMIEVVAAVESGALASALRAIDEYDALVVTSANAIRHLCDAGARIGWRPSPASPPAWCVGPRTAAAASSAGLRAELVPAERRDAAGLLDTILRARDVSGQRILFPRAESAAEVLPRALEAAGARVDAPVLYRTRATSIDVGALRLDLVSGRLWGLTFASPSAVHAFAAHLDRDSRTGAGRCIVVALGDSTAAALNGEDLPVTATADESSVEGVVEALVSQASRVSGGTS